LNDILWVAASTTLIAIIFPYFSLLLGFFGGFAIAPTTYIVCHILYNPMVFLNLWMFLDVMFEFIWKPNKRFIVEFSAIISLGVPTNDIDVLLFLQLPCVIWLSIKGKSKRWTKAHYINWVSSLFWFQDSLYTYDVQQSIA